MPFIKLWRRTSRGRRLNIKRVMFFPLIVYSAYLFLDSFMLFFSVFVIDTVDKLTNITCEIFLVDF